MLAQGGDSPVHAGAAATLLAGALLLGGVPVEPFAVVPALADEVRLSVRIANTQVGASWNE